MDAHKLYQSKPFIGSSHWWAEHALESANPATRVLDIGAGSGVMGNFLKEKGCSELVAVDTCPKTREHLATIYKEVHSDIQEVKGKFDVVFLMDVLEHMPNPFDFLRALKPLIAENGKVFISVPNIAHWGVRIPLLFGYFEYTKRGLLDETHLQFFTRSRFLRLLDVPGFVVKEKSSSIPPLEFVLPKVIWDNQIFAVLSKMHLGMAKLLPGFFAYQHLAIIQCEPGA